VFEDENASAALTRSRDASPQAGVSITLAMAIQVADEVLGELTAAQRLILAGRTLSPYKPVPLRKLGADMGVSVARVGQLEKVALRALDDAVASHPRGASMLRAAADFGRSVGAAYKLGRSLGRLETTEGVEVETGGLFLILHKAGPFEVEDQWILRRPSDDTKRRIDQVAVGALVNDAIAPISQVTDALLADGMAESSILPWLRDYCRTVRLVDGNALRWTGTLLDRAEAILRLRGVPMSKDELAGALGASRGIGDRMKDDARFRRVGKDAYGLAEWGGESYVSVLHAIERELVTRGGRAELSELSEELASRFDVRPASVRAYAMSPRFQLFDGWVTLAEPAGYRPPVEAASQMPRGVYAWGEGGWQLRLPITTDTLRGSGIAIPTPLASWIGVSHEESVSLTGNTGSVRFGRGSSGQGWVGSLRSHVQTLGGTEGDYVFLRVPASRDSCEVALLSAKQLSPRSPLQRLLLLMGVVETLDAVPDAPTGDWEEQAWLALAFDPANPPSTSAIRRRLMDRREHDLVTLLPQIRENVDDNEMDAVLLRLVEAAGETNPGRHELDAPDKHY
jgi:hypothetical protein